MQTKAALPSSMEDFRIQYHIELGTLTREAKMEKARRGELPGPAPLGYLNRRTGKYVTTVEIDPHVAPLVREAFHLAAAGHSLRRILCHLTDKGLRSKNGKMLQVSGLWYLLNNPFYAGEVLYCGTCFAGTHQALVDSETFDRAQTLLTGRRKENQFTATTRPKVALKGKELTLPTGQNPPSF